MLFFILALLKLSLEIRANLKFHNLSYELKILFTLDLLLIMSAVEHSIHGGSSSSTQRPKRRVKPSFEQLIDGKNNYQHLQQALEAAFEGDTVAIIPPDGSDEEEINEDVGGAQMVEDVAGFLEVVRSRDDDDQPHEERIWRHHLDITAMPSGPRIATLSESHPVLSTLSPVQIFQLYYTIEFSEMIAAETNRYARQKGNMDFSVSSVDIDKFVLLLLYSSYVSLPYQEMYWERDFDANLSLPSKVMSRQRFRNIKKYIHFCNNDNIDTTINRFAKVQPLFDHLNSVLAQFGIPYPTLSVDEQMVSYTGRHTTKQYMRNKPIKWGYKLWVLADSTGYPYHVSPYQGARGHFSPETKPLGYRVVMEMVDVVQKVSDPSSHEIYMDNFFTSYDLLRDLKKRNMRATGVIQNNRLRKVLRSESEIKIRGEYETVCDGNVRIIRLLDSRLVNLATNFDSDLPLHSVSRHSKTGGFSFRMPHAFSRYNSCMGGVDLTNRAIVDYPIAIAGKKWYWPLFINVIALMQVGLSYFKVICTSFIYLLIDTWHR